MAIDPYATLGVSKDASAEAIKKAYRKIARESHPDLNPGDKASEDRFKAASGAFELLKDPETRARFDRGEIDASGAERQPERQYYRDYAEAADNPYARGPFDRGQRGRAEDFGDASDIFAEFMRQQQRGASRGGDQGFAARGPDRRYSMEVDFLDAARGGKRQITLPEGGALEVTLPRGVASGQTLRLRGKGGAGFGGGPAGDALLTITVAAHPVFERDGNDILVTLPITIDEAVLGASVEAPTIDGPVKVKVPRGASSGQTLRLRGRGVHPAGAKSAGDQKIELKIVMPPTIDDDLAAFMETWRTSHAYTPRKGAS